MSLLKNKVLVGFVFILILSIMAIPFLNLPHFWDGILWTNSAEWMSRNNFNLILPGSRDYGGLDVGHPPLLFFSLALVFHLFGTSLIASHLVMLFFAFLTVYFTYLLGSYLFNEKIGFVASIILLFSPLFYAQSHIINLDLPLAAFTVMTVYFVLKNRIFHYLITASLLVLTKEPGVLTIIAVTVYIFIKNFKGPKKELIKKCLIYASPLFVLIFWALFHWNYQSQAILGHSSEWRPITFIIFFRFLNRIKIFFFDEFHWVLTLFILISLSSNIKKLFSIKKIIFSIGVGIFSLFLFTCIFKLLLDNLSLLISIISSVRDAFIISEKNLREVLLNFYSYRFLFTIFIAVSVLIKGNISFSNFKHKRLIPILLMFLFYFTLFSWTFYQPRYTLPLYPFFFIFSVNAVNRLFPKKLFCIVISIVIILLITQWCGHSNDTRGYLLEKNLEYRDSVITHKDMVGYIETNFPKATVLTYSFMIDELRYSHLGYVQNTISPLDYTHYDSRTKKTSFTLNTDDWYFYQCYSKNQCDISTQIHEGQGDIRTYDIRYKEYLTSEDFDLFYYSPQSPYPKSLVSIVDDFNLVLIKRFERNGKYTELYATEKFLSRKPKLL